MQVRQSLEEGPLHVAQVELHTIDLYEFMIANKEKFTDTSPLI